MKVLVVDDEILARKRIAKLIDEEEFKVSVLEASNGKEAREIMLSWEPDIVFLDIQMTDMTGFEVLAELENEKLPIIIFVTAFDHFAVKAFEVKAVDFLLKPFKRERFKESYRRALKQVELNLNIEIKDNIKGLLHLLNNNIDHRTSSGPKYLERIVLKLAKKYFFIEVEDIKYITSSSYYAQIFTKQGDKHLYRTSMTDLMEKLSPELFIRVNRSSILNRSRIKEIISEGQGDFSIRMDDGQTFSLSQKYKSEFLKVMDIK